MPKEKQLNQDYLKRKYVFIALTQTAETVIVIVRIIILGQYSSYRESLIVLLPENLRAHLQLSV
jgi:hypothetical protein